MRTKTLLLSAALGAACVASATAQVYSVNAVGYVNVRVAPNFSIIANPLTAANNSVASLFANVPEDTTIYKFVNGAYQSSAFSFGAWSDPALTLAPGEGAFVQNVSGAEFTVTFVGEVPQGTLTTALNSGFTMVSSKVPQTGRLQADLGYSPTEDDTVYQFNAATQQYKVSSFAFGAWDPADPTINVGEGFFLQRSAAGNWTRTFSVSP